MDPLCPFHSSLDMYFDHEENGKQVNYRNQWLCTYSKKLFRAERYVDLHLHKFWGSRLRGGEAAVCLADWCDILGCDRKGSGISGSDIIDVAPHDRSPHRSHEHRCQAVVHACFPPSLGENNMAVQRMLIRSLCDSAGGQHVVEKLGGGGHPRRDPSLVRSASASIMSILWYTMVAIVTCGSLVFYICYGLQRWDATIISDLKRRGSSGQKFKWFKQW